MDYRPGIGDQGSGIRDRGSGVRGQGSARADAGTARKLGRWGVERRYGLAMDAPATSPLSTVYCLLSTVYLLCPP